MWLTKVSITRPVFITMVVGALIVLGLRSMREMPPELYPKIDIPYVTISTVYVGAGPEEIETLVTKPLEEAVSSVNNVKNVVSYSQDSVSIISVEFLIGTDLNIALSDVREKVDAARRALPREVEAPVLSKLDVGAMPVVFIGVSSRRPLRELRHLVDEVIKERLSKISGVAAVSVTGGEVREIQVNIDQERLEAYGLSLSQVAQALALANLNLPSGKVEQGQREYAVRVLGEFKNVDEIRHLRLRFPGPQAGLVLRLEDLAEVVDAAADRAEITRVNGRESIGLLIQKTADANTVRVVDSVRDELAALKKELPEDVEFTLSQDQSEKTREALADVQMSLILAILIVVFVVFLFLHNIRGTFIVAIAIPTSIISTFIIMYFAGFTLNMMTMLALSLVVGILVDDSIVVLENIFRHLQAGEGPREAAFNGRTEIGLAAVTITLTDVVVFVPIAFMGGLVGQFFRQFGLTVAIATLFSLFVSFTLTPMLASRWFRRGEEMESQAGFFARFDAFYHALDRGYRRLLAWALRHRAAVVLSGVLALVGVSLVGCPRLGFEFFPQSDAGSVGITVEMPVGTRLEVTDAVMREIEERVTDIPEVETVFTNVGMVSGSFRGGGEQGEAYGQIMLDLIPKVGVLDRILHPFKLPAGMRTRSDQDIAAMLRQRLADLPGAAIKVSVMSHMGGGSSPIEIELRSNDMDELLRVAEAITHRLEGIPGILNPDLSWRIGKPEVQVRLDRVKAAELGFSVAQVAQVLRDAIEGNTSSKFRESGDEYDLRVRLQEMDRQSLTDVGRIVLGSVDGEPIYLADVATLSRGSGPTKIDRKNRMRQVSVVANLKAGYPLGNMQRVINREIADVDLGHVLLHWGGQAEMMRESGGHLGSALLLSIILVYMLMAALFENFLHPLTIMLSLPMALVGAIIALVLAGQTLSIVAMIGVIMLVGLVTKNAILLIDYTNTLRARGLARNEAILEAGPTRLRPILMTTLAMVFGLLPIAMKLGRGAEARSPMGVTVIGGLVLSTLLTLVMIPVVYTLFDDLTNWLRRLWRREGWSANPEEKEENPA